MTATDFDWDAELASDEKVEVRDTNVMPRTGTSRTPTGARRSSTRTTKRLDNLKSNLSTQMFQAGAMISMGLPVTGTYICTEAETFPDAVIQLARKKAEWIEALERVADIGPGITVGRTVLGIAASMGVDRYHRSGGTSGFDPDKRACAFLGVTAAYYKVYKDSADAATGDAGIYAPPPNTFQPVS